MIRVAKPVRLMEWGEGTNTTNQVWSVAGEGKIVSHEMKNGLTTLQIQCNGGFTKKNSKDNELKITQPGEGMAMNSNRYGEVALGVLKSVSGSTVTVEILTATKIDTRAHLPNDEQIAQVEAKEQQAAR